MCSLWEAMFEHSLDSQLFLFIGGSARIARGVTADIFDVELHGGAVRARFVGLASTRGVGAWARGHGALFGAAAITGGAAHEPW